MTAPSAAAAEMIAALSVKPGGDTVSAREAPSTVPTLDHMMNTRVVAVNGGRELTPQVAQVEYLSDAQKLLLPAGLFGFTGGAQLRRYELVNSIANAIKKGAGYPDIAASACHAIIGVDNTEGTYCGPPSTWDNSLDSGADDYIGDGNLRVDIDFRCLTQADGGVWIPRGEDDTGSPGVAIMTMTYGAEEGEFMEFVSLLAAGEENPEDGPGFWACETIEEQFDDYLSASFGLNYSINDYSALTLDLHRFKDAQCQAEPDLGRLKPALTSYTTGIIAALNLASMAGNPMLAWTRAYGTSMGLLPHVSSLHNREYQVTPHLPEDSELEAVTNAHPTGKDAQRYIRACCSIIAAFGMLHLANDHTYKSNDKELIRKARVAIAATRTVMTDTQNQELTSDAMLPVAIRTCAHPFGLASTWYVFRCGLAHEFISEPLQIRTTTVPPPVAKVGIAVSIMEKMMSLPVGSFFRKTFGSKHDDIKQLREQVVRRAPEYSALHKHYGHAARQKLTNDDIDKVNSMMPIVAGYTRVFEVDANGDASGAALSAAIANVVRDNTGQVMMYQNAFDKYASGDVDLETLITGKTKAKPVAAGAEASN